MENKEKSNPIMIPEDILQRLTIWCESNGLGMFLLGNDNVSMVVIGTQDYNPDQVSIVCASILLRGVIDGTFHEDNIKMHEEQNKTPKH